MVKGVTKTIIEINDTGSECFEKILLFVNLNYNGKIKTADEVKNITAALSHEKPPLTLRQRDRRRKRIILLSAAGAAVLLAVATLLLM